MDINNEIDDLSKSNFNNIKESKDELDKDKKKCPRCGCSLSQPNCSYCYIYFESDIKTGKLKI